MSRKTKSSLSENQTENQPKSQDTQEQPLTIKKGSKLRLGAKTKKDVVEYLNNNAFIQMYTAFQIQKVEDSIELTGVIDGGTYVLSFTKKK